MLTIIKHDFITGREIPETHCEKDFKKTWISQKILFFSCILNFKKGIKSFLTLKKKAKTIWH